MDTFEEGNERNWKEKERGVKSNRKQTHDDTKLRLEKLFTQLSAPEIQFFVETERKKQKDRKRWTHLK